VGDVDSSTLLLQAASGLTQEGAITTDQLLLGGDQDFEGGGDFVILSDTLENVAFNIPAGNLALTTSQVLNIAFVQFNDLEDPRVPNFIFDESIVSGTARIEAASINVNTQVQAETLILNVDDSIVQGQPFAAVPNADPVLIPSTPSIIAASLSVSATTATLDQVGNQIGRLAGNITGTGTAFEFNNVLPVTFAVIDNTVETTTRLRPDGVAETFSPLATINGLTVAGTADITSGGTITTEATNSVVFVQPIIGADDDGSNMAVFLGDATLQADILARVDAIYAPGGIDIEFLPAVVFNNTFVNSGDGTFNANGDRGNELAQIGQIGDDAGVGSADPTVLDQYYLQLIPGAPNTAAGVAFVPGTVSAVRGDSLQSAARRATIIAHEIGHNLGLGHNNIPGNLLIGTGAGTNTDLNAEQFEIIFESPSVVEGNSEPFDTIVTGGFTQEANAPVIIGSANFSVLNDGDIVLLNPNNDIDFNSTDALNVSVALVDGSNVTGITADLDLLIQSVGELTIANANTIGGNITINTGGDVLVGEISSGGSTTVTSGGSINDFQGELSATGTITLDAVDEIDGVDFADQSVVVTTADTGDISLLGVGDLVLQNVIASTGAVGITTAGNILVGSVTSASTIDVVSSGSINDLQDDLVADFTATGLVTLNAIDEIGGGATPTTFDTRGQLEFGPNTLTVQSTDGGIVVGGDGPLIFQDIKTPDGLVISAPDSLILRNVMALSADLSAVSDVTIESVMTVNETIITAGGNLDVEDVMASSATLTAGENLDVVNVTTTTGDAILVATGNLNATTVFSDSGMASLQSGGTLTTESVTGTDATLTSVGDLTPAW